MSEPSPINSSAAPTAARLNGLHRTRQEPSAPSLAERSSDQLELSDRALLLSRLRELPEVRSDLIQRVREEIESGGYETAERLDRALEALVSEITDAGQNG